MPGTAGKFGDRKLVQGGADISAATAHLIEAFQAMQPQYRLALLDIAEVYAERYPIAKGVYIL